MKLTKLAFAILTIATMLTTTSCNNSTSGDSAPAVESNQALDAIYTRTSVRQYDASRAIAKDTVDMILRAAMSAPTAVNRQPWAFVVIDKREILDSLAELNQSKGTTIVMVLHDINLSARYADWLFAMRKGKLLAQGEPGDILTPELIKEIYGLDCVVMEDPVSCTPYVVPKGRHHMNTALVRAG